MSEPPLLLLSSGARPRYLEDIARALALPNGGTIQFRYETSIIAPGVKEFFSKKSLVGRACYLCYLDTSDPTKEPEFVPVREAHILELSHRGSSFIFRMRASRYFRTAELDTIVALMKGQALDRLPSWAYPIAAKSTEMTGYWVNFLDTPVVDNLLIEHDAVKQTHLDYFEQTVRVLITHTPDFSADSTKLFFNVVKLADEFGDAVPLVENKWSLSADTKYRLEIYHYYPDLGPTINRPIFWIGGKRSGTSISMLGPELVKADSEYDTKFLEILTSGSTKTSQNGLTIFRTNEPDDYSKATAELIFAVEVRSDRMRNVIQAVFIGVFVSAPALIALGDKLDTWRAPVAIVAGLLAGFASVFKFSRSA